MNLEERINKLILRSIVDSDFKQKLFNNTEAALKDFGISLKQGVNAHIYLNKEDIRKINPQSFLFSIRLKKNKKKSLDSIN